MEFRSLLSDQSYGVNKKVTLVREKKLQQYKLTQVLCP